MAKLSDLAKEKLQQVFPNDSHLTLNTYFYDSDKALYLPDFLKEESFPETIFAYSILFYGRGVAREEVDLVAKLAFSSNEFRMNGWPIRAAHNKLFKSKSELNKYVDCYLNQEVNLGTLDEPKPGKMRLFQLAFSNKNGQTPSYFVEMTETYATLMYDTMSETINSMDGLFKNNYEKREVEKTKLELLVS